jgi:hypothetical protein
MYIAWLDKEGLSGVAGVEMSSGGMDIKDCIQVTDYYCVSGTTLCMHAARIRRLTGNGPSPSHLTKPSTAK